MVYSMFTNVQTLLEYTSLALQLKVMLAFIALFKLRWQKPDIERPVKVRVRTIGYFHVVSIGTVRSESQFTVWSHVCGSVMFLTTNFPQRSLRKLGRSRFKMWMKFAC